ncbi:MAG: HEAT repeat domain-containing protein [Planctomycetes bacterium]|nr:HEAT repeat domain-containing protein [Planctomycetota bacterium]
MLEDWTLRCRSRVAGGHAAAVAAAAARLPFAPNDTQARFLPDTAFRTEHVRLELELDLDRQKVNGVCKTTLTVLAPDARTLAFDAVGMKVRGVRLAGDPPRPLRFRHDGKVLTVSLPRAGAAGARLTLDIDYALDHPRGGLAFVPAHASRPNRPTEVWTQGQTDDARCWFPCRDLPGEKATTELVATVPAGFRAISNGILVDERPAAGGAARTFHWRMDRPHSLYLVTLTVGRFDEVREEWDGIPILYYCEKGRADEVKRGFRKTPEAVRFLSEYTGVRYPYAKYAQIAAADFLGGMENTSATTQTDAVLLDARAALDTDFDSLVSHELAHQWFGDLVTCREWSHAWLNESFATYCEILFAEHDRGEDEARYDLYRDAASYLEEASGKYSRPTVTRQWRESFNLFDAHLYERGACVLHFLRRQLGEPAWRAALKAWLERHAYTAVETRDLVEAFRAATGRSIDRWIEEWILRAGHPELKATYAWDAKAKTATVRISQKGAASDPKAAYAFPLTLRFVGRAGTTEYRIELKDAEHALTCKLPAEPDLALLDPDYGVPLAKIEWQKPRRLWENQLLRDPDVVGRIAAAEAVAGWGTDAAAALLERALRREKFWGVQTEIVRALAGMHTPAAHAALARMLDVPHPKVRRAVVEGLGEFRDAALIPVFAGIMRKDPSYLVCAEAVRALGKTRRETVRPFLERALATPSWCEVVRAAGVTALVELAGNWQAARRYLAPALADRVRAAAVRALGAHAKGEPEAIAELLRLAADERQIVRITAVRVLGQVGDPAAHAGLVALQEKAGNSMERGILDWTARSLRGGQAGELPKAKPARPARRGTR